MSANIKPTGAGISEYKGTSVEDDKKKAMFGAMVKNFSHMAYINTGGKGMQLYP